MTDPIDQFGQASEEFEKDSAPKNVEHTILNDFSLEFAPWHKPRKQWVRVNQWAKTVGDLLEVIKINSGSRSLRYLSLPGPDLLDVRSIQPICVAKKVKLHFTGIINGADVEGNTARHRSIINEVRSLPGVDESSDVVPDRFEQLVSKKSTAYTRVLSLRQPYDVINIDLCGPIATRPTGVEEPNIVNAIYSLLEHQARNQKDDWVLFITTTVGKGEVESGTVKSLLVSLNKILKDDPSLYERLIEASTFESNDFEDGQIVYDKLSESGHANCVSMGFGVWILSKLLSENPPWQADMMPQYEYHVSCKGPTCDMISLGFWIKKIKPVPVPDLIGLAVVSVEAAPRTPEQVKEACHKKIMRQIASKVDLDILLHANPEAYNDSLQLSEKLLVACGYAAERYQSWAEEQQTNLVIFLKKFGLIKDGDGASPADK